MTQEEGDKQSILNYRYLQPIIVVGERFLFDETHPKVKYVEATGFKRRLFRNRREINTELRTE